MRDKPDFSAPRQGSAGNVQLKMDMLASPILLPSAQEAVASRNAAIDENCMHAGMHAFTTQHSFTSKHACVVTKTHAFGSDPAEGNLPRAHHLVLHAWRPEDEVPALEEHLSASPQLVPDIPKICGECMLGAQQLWYAPLAHMLHSRLLVLLLKPNLNSDRIAIIGKK